MEIFETLDPLYLVENSELAREYAEEDSQLSEAPLPYVYLSSLFFQYLPDEGVSFSLTEKAEDLDDPYERVYSALESLRAMGALEYRLEDDTVTIIRKNRAGCSVNDYRAHFGFDTPVNPAR